MSKQVFGTKEWAELSANITSGCPHNCAYCYAKAETSLYYPEIQWKCYSTPQNPLLDNSIKKLLCHKPSKVMFPTKHDIFPENLDACIETILALLNVGHELLIVSKPTPQCILKICENTKEFKDKILFRFTIGSFYNRTLLFWEPHAPSFLDRTMCLQLAYDLGFKTSVSCEPMLDLEIDKVVTFCKPFVTDAIWLGKANFLPDRLLKNGADQVMWLAAYELLRGQNDAFIWELYRKYENDPKIKWKESIKKIVGIEIPTEPGKDV